MKLVDSHSHLFLEDFQSDLPQVMVRAREAGVTHIFMPNIDSTTIEPMLKVCSEYKGYCFPMIGLHPTSVDAGYEKELAVVAGHLAMPDGYVAIGEIGMDLYWDKTYLKEQQIAFERQVRWALEYGLPVVIHCREAFDEISALLQSGRVPAFRGVFHSFTGSAEQVRLLRGTGDYYFGINGIVTFKNAHLEDMVREVGIGRILLETDAPYLAPVPYRGKRNEPSYLPYMAKRIAEILDITTAEVEEATTANAVRLFGEG